MRFCSPAENDTRNFRQYGCSATVIPAQAGIQVCFPAEVAWIPPFAGMTKPKGAVVLRCQHDYFHQISNFLDG